MNEVIQLLRENNAMLKEILAYIKQQQACDDMRQFSINVAANLFIEALENNQKLKDKLKSNFKL